MADPSKKYENMVATWKRKGLSAPDSPFRVFYNQSFFRKKRNIEKPTASMTMSTA